MIKITQRTKKSDMTIEGKFPFPDNLIDLKISISPDALKHLYFLSLGDPKKAGEIITHKFLEPAYTRITGKPGRGIHSGRDPFTTRIKILAAFLDATLTWWLKRRRERWRGALKNLVKEMEEQSLRNEKTGNKKTRKKRITPHTVTAFILEKYYGKERWEKYGLFNWTDNPERFRRTYISGNEFRRWFENPKTSVPRLWNAEPIITRKDPQGFVNLLTALDLKRRH